MPHESHNTILCVLSSMVHVALGKITALRPMSNTNK